MEKVKNNKLMTIHLILMGLLCILSIVSAGIIFSGNIPSGFDTSAEQYKTTTTLYGIDSLLKIVSITLD